MMTVLRLGLAFGILVVIHLCLCLCTKIMTESKKETVAMATKELCQSLTYQSPMVGIVSFGSSWERRWQTVAMFSCSLSFLLPSALFCWSMVILCFAHAAYSASYYSKEDTQDNNNNTNTMSLAVATLVAMYLSWILVMDSSPTTGSRTPVLRHLRSWWNHSCDYLPLLLVKTADLPVGDTTISLSKNNPKQQQQQPLLSQQKNYVLGYHPHGIISVGCFGAFATDGARTLDLSIPQQKKRNKKEDDDDDDDDDEPPLSPSSRGFSSLFPGLDRRVITLPQNFTVPLLREYFLHMGALTSDKQTFRNVLAKPNTALIVVVGGAAESMETQQGAIDLVLEKRRGFVREAIMANASLVPVIGFGENDLYRIVDLTTQNPIHHSRITTLQHAVKKYLGFAMPLFAGRGMFLKNFGIMPQRKPVVVVVGAPIPPPPPTTTTTQFHPLIDRETDEPLNDHGKILKEHHAKYIQALVELHAKYKNATWNSPGRDRRSSLKIVK
jgi:2-acylglycerol O-acyltransferase 2